MFIWIGQSKGSILCYYSTSVFFIIFLNDLDKFKKFLTIISITLFSIVISNEIINVAAKNLHKTGEQVQLRVFEKKAGSYTSGRIALWKTAIKKYEKNKLFGYGPQADRILLLDPEDFDSGNNVSNTMIYGLLTGGYFSLVMIILIYIYTGYMILNYFLIKKIFLNKFSINKENIFVVASIVYISFFMIRSIFENSFGVFSIDFLITILSLFVIENKLLKKN